jgi:hypothetical protein
MYQVPVLICFLSWKLIFFVPNFFLLQLPYVVPPRTRPLFDLDGDLAEVLKDFDGKFERGECAGWAKEQQGAMAHTGAHLDLSAFDSPEELASLGLDRWASSSLRPIN